MTMENKTSIPFHLKHNIDSSTASRISTRPRVGAECLDFEPKAEKLDKKSDRIKVAKTPFGTAISPMLHDNANFGQDEGTRDDLRTEQSQQSPIGFGEVENGYSPPPYFANQHYVEGNKEVLDAFRRSQQRLENFIRRYDEDSFAQTMLLQHISQGVQDVKGRMRRDYPQSYTSNPSQSHGRCNCNDGIECPSSGSNCHYDSEFINLSFNSSACHPEIIARDIKTEKPTMQGHW